MTLRTCACGLLLAAVMALAPRADALGLLLQQPSVALQSDVQPVSHRTCGLRIDGAGPAVRCGRYEQVCRRDGNGAAVCAERRGACSACAEAFNACESRVGHLRGLLGNCGKCVAAFKRCTRVYARRLPIERP